MELFFFCFMIIFSSFFFVVSITMTLSLQKKVFNFYCVICVQYTIKGHQNTICLITLCSDAVLKTVCVMEFVIMYHFVTIII